MSVLDLKQSLEAYFCTVKHFYRIKHQVLLITGVSKTVRVEIQYTTIFPRQILICELDIYFSALFPHKHW